VLGALILNWADRLKVNGVRDPLMLTAAQLNREVARERLRATRRAFPFCVITIEINSGQRRYRQSRLLARLLHRNLRMTDQKAFLGGSRFAVLLVDTPEMGGRSVVDRLTDLAAVKGLSVTMKLQVHDPNGFNDSDDDETGTGGNRVDPMHKNNGRRRGDEVDIRWLPVNGEVQVTSEDALVPQPRHRMVIKRTLDIVGSTFGLIVLSPILIAAVVAIRRGDGQTALFKQTREGKGGKPFTIYKLRTMVVDAEHSQAALREQSHRDGPAFKISHDPRVTPIGHLLRKTCVDELPQLLNVLRGEMSLVGPRPLPWHESRACNAWHRRRLDVRPGMTCYWQVNKSSVTTFDDWMRLDLRYLDQFNVFEDLKLIAKTVTVPMLGRGSE
jgi:lipopolysaccharide/colanic/teichoic acid biosynthesis glycosyltransferase